MGSKAQHPSMPSARKTAETRIQIIGTGGSVDQGLGSLTTISDPAFPYRSTFEPIYASSKTALNAVTLAMMIELEATDIKVNLKSPVAEKRESVSNIYKWFDSVRMASWWVPRKQGKSRRIKNCDLTSSLDD